MLTAKTIVGLACLVSQGGTLQQVDPNAQLTKTDVIHIVELAEKQPCLPESFEKLVKETEDSMQTDGWVTRASSQPTKDCMSPL